MASALWVATFIHRAECARFDSFIVRGPTEADCDIFAGAIGKDGNGRLCIYRDGVELCVRPNRYALARSLGRPLEGTVLALHECDIPLLREDQQPGESAPARSGRQSARQHDQDGSDAARRGSGGRAQ